MTNPTMLARIDEVVAKKGRRDVPAEPIGDATTKNLARLASARVDFLDENDLPPKGRQ